MGPQFPPWVDELKVVVAQEPGADLVHLEKRQVATEAKVTATSELRRRVSISSGETKKKKQPWNLVTLLPGTCT